jgi:gamma-glutamyltranspeptidase / glutathione hydrolase
MLKYFKIVSIFCAAIFSIFSINTIAEAPDPVRSRNGMVVSASELASKVGLLILRKGGNAIDAAVATGFALAVTYPSAGNLGGGGFMVIHLKDGRNVAIDYREKAPLAAYRDMYLDDAGNFLMELSTRGATASGVPGSVAGLIYALENYGTMTLAEVLQPAINLAQDGFQLDYSLARSIQFALRSMDEYESSMKIFSNNGIPYAEGEIFKQPDLANTLKLIKEKGKDGFYKGKIAELIVNQVQSMGGYISPEDLEKYEAVERTPIIGEYRGHKIVSMPPSSSGGLVLMQMLNVLENFNFTKEEWGSSKYIHTLSEIMKFAYADRSVHIGDEDFYDVPKDWLISKEYAKKISEKISDYAIPSSKIAAGIPFATNESEETTHYSVCDAFGNAVSTTTTINSSYGNKLVVDGAGFLLNNEMDDFSSKPGEPNQFGLLGGEANSIQPEKRMLSAMTPTIVLKDEKPFLIVGSPGGSTIITVVLQVILNCIDFEMDIQDAINQPRIHHQWLPERIDYEQFGLTVDVKENLQLKGHIIGRQRTLGRAEGIMIDNENNLFFGATDPRGYGSAEGF